MSAWIHNSMHDPWWNGWQHAGLHDEMNECMHACIPNLMVSNSVVSEPI